MEKANFNALFAQIIAKNPESYKRWIEEKKQKKDAECLERNDYDSLRNSALR